MEISKVIELLSQIEERVELVYKADGWTLTTGSIDTQGNNLTGFQYGTYENCFFHTDLKGLCKDVWEFYKLGELL